ncbi:hypothetical protein SLEP1_g19026 [Rubroshorea leprosula]|nr:hypothetical protein SLEP1_g19026 [Rubroshorea leprosula]
MEKTKCKITIKTIKCPPSRSEEINLALGCLRSTGQPAIRAALWDFDFQITLNLGLKPARLQFPQLEPNPQIQFHINTVNSRILLLIALGNSISAEQHQFLPLKRGVEVTGTLVPLIERRRLLGSKPLVLVVLVGLDAVVVDADFLVGVAHEDEGSQTQDDDRGDYELDKEAQEAAAATARTMAVAVIGRGRWDSGVVVGSAQVGMFLYRGITRVRKLEKLKLGSRNPARGFGEEPNCWVPCRAQIWVSQTQQLGSAWVLQTQVLGSSRNPLARFAEPRSGFREEVPRTQQKGSLRNPKLGFVKPTRSLATGEDEYDAVDEEKEDD